MFGIKLSTLSLLLGLVVALPSAYAILRPSLFGAAARKFPRHPSIGTFLMLLATGWFVYNVSQESLSDFAKLKQWFYLLFAAVGLGSCLVVRDFLAVRGLAVVLLLLAKLMVDTARWADTEWRLVITTLAYVFVIVGMWLTISPWRLRDWIEWATINEKRIRLCGMIRLVFSFLLIVLALTAYRTAEAKPVSNAFHRVAAAPAFPV
jgi:hypothetical protein